MRSRVVFTLFFVGLAGCKVADRERTSRPDLPPGDTASRAKARGGWLEGPTPALTAVGTPSADSWTSPTDPSFDVNREVRGLLAGFVEGPDGRKLSDVFIEVASADPGADPNGAPVGVMTDRQGYFLIKGLKPKHTYMLTAKTNTTGTELGGRVYAETSREQSQFIRLSLIPGLSFPGATDSKPAGGSNPTPPAPTLAVPPPVVPSGGTVLPEAAPLRTVPLAPAVGSSLPDPQPLRNSLPRSEPAPSQGTYSPVPARIEPIHTPNLPGGAAPSRSVPTRPDLMTEGKDGLFRPPAASVPRGPSSESKSLPSPSSHAPQSRVIVPDSEFVLVDPLGVSREFPSGRPGDLVLLDFMTSTCVPCKKVIPTLKNLQSRYAAKGLEVIGVLSDPAPLKQRQALAAKYRQREGLNYLLFVEPGMRAGSLGERFEVEAYPTVVLIDGTGKVLWTGHPNDLGRLEQAIQAHFARTR